MKKPRSVKGLQFTNMTREEAVAILRSFNDPELNRLASWVAESAAFSQCSYNARVAIADAERYAERLMSVTRVT